MKCNTLGIRRMDKLISIVEQETKELTIDVIVVITLISILAALITGFLSGKKSGKWLCLHFLAFEYAQIMLFLTLFSRELGQKPDSFPNYGLGFNIYGIYSINQTFLVFLNCVLFIPWGIFISLYLNNKNRRKNICLVTVLALVCSLGIECTQLLTKTGFFEPSDLLMNTLGGFIGAIAGEYLGQLLNKD